MEQELTQVTYKVKKRYSYGFESHLYRIQIQEPLTHRVSRRLFSDRFTVLSSENTHHELEQIVTKLGED